MSVSFYLNQFKEWASSQSNEPKWLSSLRREAISRFEQVGFPTAKDEAWKGTSVAPLVKIPFRLAQKKESSLSMGHADSSSIEPRLSSSSEGLRPESRSLERSEGLFGVELLPFSRAWREKGERAVWIEESLKKSLLSVPNPFDLLNLAFLQDGILLFVPPKVTLTEPLRLIFETSAHRDPVRAHTRVIVVVGEGSRLKIEERHTGEGTYFSNSAMHLILGTNAQVEHYKIQRESEKAYHISTLQADQGRESHFVSYSLSLGGALVRNDIGSRLAEEGASCKLQGLFVVSGNQHVDHHTEIDHATEHGTSVELYKGILSDRATGVFNGKILVRQDAQKTDARQVNKNLLLSEEAIIDTHPQLEIYANDVKCAHGAAIGRLDPDALFYLRSRGIGEEEAKGLLTMAFAQELIGEIGIPSLREEINEFLSSAFFFTPGDLQ